MDGDKGVISRGAALDIKCHQEMEELAGTRLRGHFVTSTTYREGLMALPRTRQVIDV
jgi:hypothetical protein